MPATSKVATATMTEVKNKIGTVFDKADKYGQVVISSYGRERYIISKIEDNDYNVSDKPGKEAVRHEDRRLMQAGKVVNKVEPEIKQTEVTPVTPEPAEVEIRSTSATAEKPERLLSAEHQDDAPSLRGAFLDIESHLWDRKSKIEMDWTNKVKLSF